MEYWSVGVLTFPTFHYSSTPFPHSSFYERIQDLSKASCRTLTNLISGETGDRVGHDHQRMVGRSERISLGLGQNFKLVGHDRNDRFTLFLQADAVVDTPRCARPSITQAVDNEVGLGCQVCKVLLGSALLGRNFGATDNAGNVVTFAQKFFESGSQEIALRLAVIKHTENLPVEIEKRLSMRDLFGRRPRLSFWIQNYHQIHLIECD